MKGTVRFSLRILPERASLKLVHLSVHCPAASLPSWFAAPAIVCADSSLLFDFFSHHALLEGHSYSNRFQRETWKPSRLRVTATQPI